MNHVCAWYPRGPEEDVTSPGTGVMSGYEAATWILGIELGSSGRAARAHYCCAISPALVEKVSYIEPTSRTVFVSSSQGLPSSEKGFGLEPQIPALFWRHVVD